MSEISNDDFVIEQSEMEGISDDYSENIDKFEKQIKLQRRSSDILDTSLYYKSYDDPLFSNVLNKKEFQLNDKSKYI